MDSSRFDDLTKAFATSTTRRQALQRIGGTLAGSMLAAWPFSQAFATGGGNSQCAQFCATVFGADTPGAKQCTSDAAHGQGLCYTCGPAAPTPHPVLCGQVCCPAAPANATATCTGGVCGFVCNSGYQTCNGTCIANNECCGGCPSGQTCQNGQCVTIPHTYFQCRCNDQSIQHTCSTDTCDITDLISNCTSLCDNHSGYAGSGGCAPNGC